MSSVQGDRVLVAVTRDGLLRARAAATSDLVGEALAARRLSRLASLALARALTTAAVYPVTEKDAERVSFQWSGKGVLGTLMAEIRPPGFLRALATVPDARQPEGRYRGRRGVGFGLLPGGFLSILKQDATGAWTQGQVELSTGEIDEDLEHFFRSSEQTPTRVRVLTNLNAGARPVESGGVLVQCLGGAPEDLLPDARLHERLGARDAPERMLEVAFGGRSFDVLEEHPLSYRCPCSRERIEDGIMLLEAGELLDMINEDEGARVHCDFCGTLYAFDRLQLEDILARKLTS